MLTREPVTMTTESDANANHAVMAKKATMDPASPTTVDGAPKSSTSDEVSRSDSFTFYGKRPSMTSTDGQDEEDPRYNARFYITKKNTPQNLCIRLRNTDFYVHREILQEKCGYFKNLLADGTFLGCPSLGRSDLYDFQEATNSPVSVRAFTTLLDYLYSGKLKVAIRAASELLDAAEFLSISLKPDLFDQPMEKYPWWANYEKMNTGKILAYRWGNSNRHPDICVRVEENFYLVHSAVITQRSRYFKAIISKDGKWKERLQLKRGRMIEFTAAPPTAYAFETVLDYIYCEKIFRQPVDHEEFEDLLDTKEYLGVDFDFECVRYRRRESVVPRKHSKELDGSQNSDMSPTHAQLPRDANLQLRDVSIARGIEDREKLVPLRSKLGLIITNKKQTEEKAILCLYDDETDVLRIVQVLPKEMQESGMHYKVITQNHLVCIVGDKRFLFSRRIVPVLLNTNASAWAKLPAKAVPSNYETSVLSLTETSDGRMKIVKACRPSDLKKELFSTSQKHSNYTLKPLRFDAIESCLCDDTVFILYYDSLDKSPFGVGYIVEVRPLCTDDEAESWSEIELSEPTFLSDMTKSKLTSDGREVFVVGVNPASHQLTIHRFDYRDTKELILVADTHCTKLMNSGIPGAITITDNWDAVQVVVINGNFYFLVYNRIFCYNVVNKRWRILSEARLSDDCKIAAFFQLPTTEQ
ncbi:uncharacterized protein [Ptychodera flava]|uniref:uncharacterized protein n=1 Tax=Ptychodera flava TaxID=63121 RepID=UPI003969CADE